MSWWLNQRFDLTGQTFGRLTALRLVSTSGPRRWECRCACGNQHQAFANNLRSGKVQSCGCVFQDAAFTERPRKRRFEWLFNRLRSDIRYPVTITYDEFLAFTEVAKCHYCGASVRWQEYSFNKQHGGAYNLDRKDNAIGYTADNCVVCCPSCNRTKGDRFTYEQFVQIGNVIRSFG